jgi:hypothetical protein
MIGLKASANHARAEKTEGRDVEIGDQCFDWSLIQKGMKRGREWCTKADRPLADIWKKWWKQFDRCGGFKGGMGAKLRKVKAHTTEEQIGTVISAADRVGNDAADEAAKEAVTRHPSFKGQNGRFKAAQGNLVRIAKWMCCLPTLREDRDVEEQKAGRKMALKKAEAKRRCKAKNAHVCVWDRGREIYRCQDCMTLKYPEEDKRHHFAQGPNASDNDWGKCTRPDRSYGRLGAVEEKGERGAHTLKILGTYVWCVKCYSFAESRPVNLRTACTGVKTTAGRHAVECLEKGYTPAMSKEKMRKIDGEKARVTLKAAAINMVADEGTTERSSRHASFAERLVESGKAAEPADRFEEEEMGSEREQLRYRGEDASQALRWHRVSAVTLPDSAIDCTGL